MSAESTVCLRFQRLFRAWFGRIAAVLYFCAAVYRSETLNGRQSMYSIERLNKFLWCVVILMLAAGIFCKYRYKHNRLTIYDLTWQTNDSNGQIDHRWRYFIDPQTHLPRKIEKYNKPDPNTDYILKETLLITYPSDDEIEKLFKAEPLGG